MGLMISYRQMQDAVLEDCRLADDTAMRSRVKNWLNEGYLDFCSSMSTEHFVQVLSGASIIPGEAIAVWLDASRIVSVMVGGKKIKMVSPDEFEGIALDRTPKDSPPEYFTVTAGIHFDFLFPVTDVPNPAFPIQIYSSSNADRGKKITIIGASRVYAATSIRPEYGPAAHYQFTLNGTTPVVIVFPTNINIDTIIGMSKEQTAGTVTIGWSGSPTFILSPREVTHYTNVIRFYPVSSDPNLLPEILIRNNPPTLYHDSDAPYMIPERFIEGVLCFAKYKALQFSEDKRAGLAMKEYARYRTDAKNSGFIQEGASGFYW